MVTKNGFLGEYLENQRIIEGVGAVTQGGGAIGEVRWGGRRGSGGQL